MISYYMPGSFNSVANIDEKKKIRCDYYTQQTSSFADSVISTSLVTSLDTLKFPLLAQAMTPSSAVYHK